MTEEPILASEWPRATAPPVPPAPAPATPKSWIAGIPHAWATLVGEDANCDGLPEYLTPKTGCPECGSAWADVRQVAFESTCHRGEFLGGSWYVRQIGGVEPVMAVRLRCCAEHLVEYDGIRLTVIRMPSWGVIAGLMGITAAYIAGWALQK